MQSKVAHITINGRPACDWGVGMDIELHELGVTCGHRSIADATRAKKVLQKHYHSVKVVTGHCPKSE